MWSTHMYSTFLKWSSQAHTHVSCWEKTTSSGNPIAKVLVLCVINHRSATMLCCFTFSFPFSGVTTLCLWSSFVVAQKTLGYGWKKIMFLIKIPGFVTKKHVWKMSRFWQLQNVPTDAKITWFCRLKQEANGRLERWSHSAQSAQIHVIGT